MLLYVKTRKTPIQVDVFQIKATAGSIIYKLKNGSIHNIPFSKFDHIEGVQTIVCDKKELKDKVTTNIRKTKP